MNLYIILFFILSVLLYMITKYYLVKTNYKINKHKDEIEAFENELNSTSADKLKSKHNVTIKYLDVNTARQLVKKNGIYIQNMNQPNLSARHCLTIDELYEKYLNGFDEITSSEKETIDLFILNLLNDIKKYTQTDNSSYYKYVSKWLNEINIAKAKSWLEAGMPHTLDKTIVMDSGWFITPRRKTLLHELTHVHQREVEFDFEDLYKELGYYYNPENIKGMESIYPLNRNNPDGLSKFWLWKMPVLDSSSNNTNNDAINSMTMNTTNYWWIGAIFNTVNPDSLNDVDLVALKLDRDQEGHFYYLKQNPTYLNKWQPFITFFGDNPNNYHPNEMTAKFSEFYLADILNENQSEFNNYEGYKIYKKYFENMINKYYQ
jgi:hypothetical protein